MPDDVTKNHMIRQLGRDLYIGLYDQGKARTQSPTNKNDALESPTFGVIARVSQAVVQWKGLALGDLP